jgi:hypothetical protein
MSPPNVNKRLLQNIDGLKTDTARSPLRANGRK